MSRYDYPVAFRGPLPRYFQATSAELHADRVGLPGVSASTSEEGDQLSADEVDDIHLPLSVAESVIGLASPAGGRVLDPFAGYGTTLLACENLGRRAVGVELLPEHVRISRARAPKSEVIEGDSRGLYRLTDGPFDLCFTAPPFLTKNQHPQDPLTGYEEVGGDYGSYLASLGNIAAQIERMLVPGGYLILNVANIRYRDQTTTLAWDVAAEIDPVIPFVAESVLVWDVIPHDFTGDYLLSFQKPK